MRTLTGGESTLLQGASYGIYGRVWVADSLGALVDYSTAVIRAEWSEHVEESYASASVTFDRDAGASSLAPLMTADPPIDLGRELLIEVATVAIGATPAAGDWQESFRGTIRRVDPTTTEMVVDAWDRVGSLADLQIKVIRSYGSGPGVANETVIQSILTDNATGFTLYTPTASGAVISPAYDQALGTVLEAARGVAESIGWTLRNKWHDGTSAFRLTFSEPDRTKTVADWTLPPDRYLTVHKLETSIDDIRNDIEVEYSDANDGGKRKVATAEDAASIAKYGRRFFRDPLPVDHPINNGTAAQAYADAIVADSAEPQATHAVESLLLWHLEIGDLLEFPENSVHYSADQKLAVVEIRHSLEGGSGRTTVTCRGKPSGGVLRYRQRALRGVGDVDVPVSLEPLIPTEVTTTGGYSVVVHDPGGYAVALYVSKKSGTGGWGDFTLVDATPNDGTTYPETVTLQEDHSSGIKFRLSYRKHGVLAYIESVSPDLDRGKIPAVTILPAVNDDTGAASATVTGDFDTASVKILARTDRYPTAAEVRAADALNGRVVDPSTVGTLVTATVGQTIYYAAFGYSATAGGGNESSVLVTAQIVRKVVPPLLEVSDAYESSESGIFPVIVRDPAAQTVGLYWSTKTGFGGWTEWVEETATPAHNATYSHTVTLTEGHPVFVRWKLVYTFAGNTGQNIIVESPAFDRGKIPLLSITLRVSPLGVVTSDIVGDFDTASVKAASSKTSFPDAQTVRAAGATNGRVVSITWPAIPLVPGETLFVSVFGYSTTGGGGNESSALCQGSITFAPTIIPKVTESFARSGSTSTLTLSISDPLRRITADEWKSQLQGGTETTYSSTWTSSTGAVGADVTLTRTKDVTLSDGKDVIVTWRFTFTDEQGVSKTISGAVSMANLKSLTKTVRLPWADFLPVENTDTWDGSNAYLTPGTADVRSEFRGALVLPKGVTLTKATLRAYRADTIDILTVEFFRTNDDGTQTSLGYVSHTGTAVYQNMEVALSQLVGSEAYNAYIYADPHSSKDHIRLLWIEMEYTVPDYSKAY